MALRCAGLNAGACAIESAHFGYTGQYSVLLCDELTYSMSINRVGRTALPDTAFNGPYSRVLSYFVAEFILRTALPVAAAFDNDYEAALIFLTITTQNTQNLMLNQATRKRYASMSDVVPEPLIRPISRMALARSTNLPRETVRRKVLKLMERGYVEETSKGLIVPPSVRNIPLYAETVAVQETNLRRLFSMVGEVIAADPMAAGALLRSISGGA
jgi:hypothetical protein